MSGNITNSVYSKDFISKGAHAHSKGSHPNWVGIDGQKSSLSQQLYRGTLCRVTSVLWVISS